MKPRLMQKRLAVAALVAVVLAGCAATAKQESTGEYIDDTAITTQVKTALVANKEVSAMAINVETFKGTVQLSGFANSVQEKEKAAEVARTVAGVKSVKNDIRLK